MLSVDLLHAVAVAARAATVAGTAAQEARRRPLAVAAKEHPLDLVTAADTMAERALRRVLSEEFPGVPVVGEELGGEVPARGSCWVADPLDGTANFVAGLPFYCTSVALVHDGVPVAAAIYDPVQGELFTARAGGGAELDGLQMRVSTGTRVARMVIATRPSFNRRLERVDNLAATGALAAASLGLRSLGASALELAWVACGRFGAMWHPRLKPWDVAAGALLVAEAGGRVDRPDGALLRVGAEGGILASNGVVHEEIRVLIAAGSHQEESDAR